MDKLREAYDWLVEVMGQRATDVAMGALGALVVVILGRLIF